MDDQALFRERATGPCENKFGKPEHERTIVSPLGTSVQLKGCPL